MSDLQKAIAELKGAVSVNIKGKSYTTVATRLEVFRNHFPDHAITTELLPTDGKYVRVKATICTPEGEPRATGMAEEDRSWGQINKTSAVENCETSAIGRALAAFGLHGGEYASADEVDLAVEKSKKMEAAHKKADDAAADAVGKYQQKFEGPALIPVPDIEDRDRMWRTWASQMQKAMQGAKAPEEVEQWWEKNEIPLSNLKKESEKAYDFLHNVMENMKAALNEEAGLTPRDAG